MLRNRSNRLRRSDFRLASHADFPAQGARHSSASAAFCSDVKQRKRCGKRAARFQGDAATGALLRAAFFNETLANWQIVIPHFGTVTGPFKLSSPQYEGPYDGEVKLSLSLCSAGALTFAAL